MNTFAIIILVALVLEFSLELAGNLLNLKALKLELPPVLQGIYKPEDYRKSQEYIRATTRFGLMGNSFMFFLLIAFWFSGGFNWFDQVVRMGNFVPLVSGLLYIGILFLANWLLGLPFTIYGTFVLEERFGFNKTTPRLWWLDHLKGLPCVHPDRLGVTGFCFGGGLAWRLLTMRQDLRAGVPFYGAAPPSEDVPKIRAAVLAIYGELDERINATIPDLEKAIHGSGVCYEKVMYPGAAHAFHNDTGVNYHPEAARDAWTRTLAHFAQHLK